MDQLSSIVVTKSFPVFLPESDFHVLQAFLLHQFTNLLDNTNLISITKRMVCSKHLEVKTNPKNDRVVEIRSLHTASDFSHGLAESESSARRTA